MPLLIIAIAVATWLQPRDAEPELGPEPPNRIERAPLEPSVEWAPRFERSVEPPPPRWVPVSGDTQAFVAATSGESERVVVYLHGMCGQPERIAEWARAAQPLGTVIALRADAKCLGGSGHYWTSDAVFLDYRIKKAIRSVSGSLGRALDDSDVVLVGYSQGAQRVEDLAHVRPSRYRRVALMSGPYPPSQRRVLRVERLAVTRGERELSRQYRVAVDAIRDGGVSAEFFELPGAAHGELGPEGAAVMHAMLQHLLD